MKKLSFMKSKKTATYVKKEFRYDVNDKNRFKLYQKVRDHCHYTGKFRRAAHSICNLRYKVPKEIHNGSTYDYHFIIKQLAEEFGGQSECLGENAEKYTTFSLPMKKEHDNGKKSIYRLKFIDSYRFKQGKLSDLVDNLSGIYHKKCKSCMERKNIKSECDFIEFKINRLDCKSKEDGKRYSKLINEAIKKFLVMYQFCNGDLNIFVLLLRKGVYRYESWVVGKDLMKHQYQLKKLFTGN